MLMNLLNESLTTGEIGKLARVSQQTIIREIDRGNLVGYRIPGSGHRRALISEVLKWMASSGVPQDLINDKYGLGESEQADAVSDMRQAGLVSDFQDGGLGNMSENTQ